MSNQENFDINNYMAIDVLEKLGQKKPNEIQIKMMEVLLSSVSLVRETLYDNRLSAQERQCLYWVARGMNSQQIAIFMNMDTDAVDECKLIILRKMNCKTMEQAIFQGMRFGHLAEHVA